MKLAYSNWHKELVHDDAIRSELNSITGGELEFSNTPYIKHRNQNFERDEYGTGGGRGGRWQQNFGGRNNNNRNNNNRNNGGGGRNNNNRNNSGGRNNNNNRNNSGSGQFKKRY